MSMKIQFDANLDYQRDAIESVTGVFAGQEICQTNFTVAPLQSWEEGSLFHGTQEDSLGIGNRLRLLSAIRLQGFSDLLEPLFLLFNLGIQHNLLAELGLLDLGT